MPTLHILDGGIAAWARAGYELFSGRQRAEQGVRRIRRARQRDAEHRRSELDALIAAAPTWWCSTAGRSTNTSASRSRPAVNVPGAELVLRVHDIAPSPQTLVVVNCAGRTRSIIGAQSLINAGVPNKVVALRNGTMGWSLAGLTCDSGKTSARRRSSRDGLAWAKSAAERVARRLRHRAHRPCDARALPRRERTSARSICSTCAIPPNTRPATCRAPCPRPAGSSCRRPTNMSARSARASCSSTTPRCAP